MMQALIQVFVIICRRNLDTSTGINISSLIISKIITHYQVRKAQALNFIVVDEK